MKCRNWQVDAHSVLAPGQPCGTQDDSCSITRVSALCSPAFQFPGRFISSSTGLYERSEPVWADQPSHDLKHWGACARNQASRTRDNSELTIFKKQKPSFLFWTGKCIFTIIYFYNCKEDLQFKSKRKEKPPKDLKCLLHLSSFILPALTDPL